LFDRPEVVARAQFRFSGSELAERIDFVGGDFLVEVPTDGDLYVVREVLHNWDDEHASRILENCHRAARPGSTLLLGEIVLPTQADPANALAFTLDLLALVVFGGRERTLAEFTDLLAGSGYVLKTVLPVPSFSQPWSLLVADRV
jgi:hypothetical protein